MTLNINTLISIYYNDQCFDYDFNLNNSSINNNYFDSLNYYTRVLLIQLTSYRTGWNETQASLRRLYE